MKFICLFSLIFLSSSALVSGNAQQAIDALASASDDQRQVAYNTLYSLVAHACHPESDGTTATQLEAEFIPHIKSEETAEMTRLYLIRYLAKIGSDKTVNLLFNIAADETVASSIRVEAISTLSRIQAEGIPERMVDALRTNNEVFQSYWWNALGVRNETSANADLLEALIKGEISLTDGAILTLGKIANPEIVGYLYQSLQQEKNTDTQVHLSLAILDSSLADEEILQFLLQKVNQVSVQAGAFYQLLFRNQDKALTWLKENISRDEATLRHWIKSIFQIKSIAGIRVIQKHLGSFRELTQITILSNVSEGGWVDWEPAVLELLDSTVSTDLKVAAINTLGVIGTANSTDKLMSFLNEKNKEIQAAAIQSLATVKDENIDVKMMALAKDASDPDHLFAIRTLAIRNSEGATEQLNSLLAKQVSSQTLKELLPAIETIGDEHSSKILLDQIIKKPNSQKLKRLQITLKRLSLRLNRNEELWESCYFPALQNAPDDESKSHVVVLLDALSNEAALKHCITLAKGENPMLAKAALRALNRWRDVQVCDFWLSVVNDEKSTQEEKTAAAKQVAMTLASDYLPDSKKDRSSIAATIFVENDSPELREALLNDYLNKQETSSIKNFLMELNPGYDLKEYQAKIEALLDQ